MCRRALRKWTFSGLASGLSSNLWVRFLLVARMGPLQVSFSFGWSQLGLYRSCSGPDMQRLSLRLPSPPFASPKTSLPSWRSWSKPRQWAARRACRDARKAHARHGSCLLESCPFVPLASDSRRAFAKAKTTPDPVLRLLGLILQRPRPYKSPGGHHESPRRTQLRDRCAAPAGCGGRCTANPSTIGIRGLGVHHLQPMHLLLPLRRFLLRGLRLAPRVGPCSCLRPAVTERLPGSFPGLDSAHGFPGAKGRFPVMVCWIALRWHFNPLLAAVSIAQCTS